MKRLLLAAALCAAATPALALFDTNAPGIVQTNQARVLASATATTGAFSAVLPAPTGTQKILSLCSFVITSGGTTTPLVVNVTVTGLSTTMNFAFVFPSTGQGLLGVAWPQCLEASAPNTAITISVPAGGTGTTAAISATGYVR